MPALLLPLAGFAVLDSLNVLNLGVTTVVVYDSRLRRRSPLPAGLSFVTGVLTATTTVGVSVVLGLTFLTERTDVEVTPTARYWAQLALGVALVVLAAVSSPSGRTPPEWTLRAARRNPWLFGVVGIVVGSGQAVTSVPYLSALTMVSARDPLPVLWPLLVFAYCATTLVPSLLVLTLSVRRSMRARRLQRRVVRTLFEYGPVVVRVMFLSVGLVLIGDALWHYDVLW